MAMRADYLITYCNQLLSQYESCGETETRVSIIAHSCSKIDPKVEKSTIRSLENSPDVPHIEQQPLACFISQYQVDVAIWDESIISSR